MRSDGATDAHADTDRVTRAALESAGAAAMIVVRGKVTWSTVALSDRLSPRQAAALARRVERGWAHGVRGTIGGVAEGADDNHDDVHVLRLGEDDHDHRLLVVLPPRPAPVPEAVSTARLTPRQMTVGRMVAEGSSTLEIAEHLGLSVATVRRHLEAVHMRLGVHRRADVVRRLGTRPNT